MIVLRNPPRAPTWRVLAALLVVTGALLLWAHVALHPPVTGSFRNLYEDMPRGHEEVRVVTDEAVRVATGEEDTALVCVDVGCPFVIRASPTFNETGPGTGTRWLFHAVVPGDAEWAPVGEGKDSGEEVQVPPRALLLEGVVWDFAPAPVPSPDLALAGLLALGTALLVIGFEYAAVGPALALGFLAQHGVALTTRLVPVMLLGIGLWLVAAVGAALVLAAIVRPRRRVWLPAGVLLLAFAAGAWVERALLSGYRPFTGIF